MCGTEGHISDNCKDAKCLRCGLPNKSYTNRGCLHCRRLNNSCCYICGGTGHVKSNCPDMWRRFHATLSGTEGIVNQFFGDADRSHKPLSQIWCSNCAKMGHYLHHCRAYTYSSYPTPVLHIVSYNNILPSHESIANISDGSSPPLSKRQKRKDEMREIKERKRAYRSLNNTPNTQQNYTRGSNSLPVTPESQSTQKVNNITESLEKAKHTLEELISERDEEQQSSSKKWRKQKKNRAKDNKSFEYISINSKDNHQNYNSAKKSYLPRNDLLSMDSKSKSKKKQLQDRQLKGNIRFNDTSFTDISRINSSKKGKKTSNQKSKNIINVSYGTSSRPPNLMNRVNKLSKINKGAYKGNISAQIGHTPNSKGDRKLLKLIGQTVGNSKKSTHYALNHILKKLKKAK